MIAVDVGRRVLSWMQRPRAISAIFRGVGSGKCRSHIQSERCEERIRRKSSAPDYPVRARAGSGTQRATDTKFSRSRTSQKIWTHPELPGLGRKIFSRELDIFIELDHPHTVHVHSVFQTRCRYFVFTWSAENGDLLDFGLKNGMVVENQARVWLKRTAFAVRYLHSLEMVYSSQKCEHFLTTANYNVKLAYFGFAGYVADSRGGRVLRLKKLYDQQICRKWKFRDKGEHSVSDQAKRLVFILPEPEVNGRGTSALRRLAMDPRLPVMTPAEKMADVNAQEERQKIGEECGARAEAKTQRCSRCERTGTRDSGEMRISIVLFVAALSAGALARSVPRDGPREPFSLEEVLHPLDKTFTTQWISSDEIVYRNLTTDDIVIFNMKTERVLVDSSVIRKYNCTSYEVSTDRTYVLLRYDDKTNYRYSMSSRYVVYSVTLRTFTDLAGGEYLPLAQWIPGRNAIIYVKDNDIYVSDMERVAGDHQITRTGVPGQVFNGVCDWVYEEEVLGRGTSLTISPDGQHLMYLNIDDRKVHETKFLEYGRPGSLDDQYEKEITMRYPKAGTAISTFQVYHYNFASGKNRLIYESRPGRDIFYGWNWVNNNTIAVEYANRVQNETETDLCDLEEGTCKKVFQDRNPKGWANFEVPLFNANATRYLARLRQKIGSDEFYHVYEFGIGGAKKKALTKGNFMVREIVDWDEEARVVYYRASPEWKPATDHVFAVSENGDGEPTCITCQMWTPEKEPCKAGRVSFNENFRYLIGTCLGPNPVVVSLYSKSDTNEIKLLRTLDDSPKTRKLMGERLQPKTMDFHVQVTETIVADARLVLPPNFDPSSKKKYPMLVYVYGGPDNPQVKDIFRMDWYYYLATKRDIIYARIDGRGTGRKGAEMMYAVYRALGLYEVQDQITVTREIINYLSFVDESRIGIWGWSYGGYATTKILEADVGGVFKCGAAVAPVTDWIYYNSIYAERYMDLPSANPEGYRNSSTLYNVENLRNKEYLLIHGTADDNVHYQHAMHLAKVLEEKNIHFLQEAYPDEGHSLKGVRPHLYYTLDSFFRKCFS